VPEVRAEIVHSLRVRQKVAWSRAISVPAAA
jgi:hypothetical protein